MASVDVPVPDEREMPNDGSPKDVAQPADMEDTVQQVAVWMTELDVLHEGILRFVHAHKALRRFGQALRGRVQDKAALYARSTQCRDKENIDEFWSHSWQQAAWKKVLCLLFLKNGIAAAGIGSLLSLLGFLLSFMQVLPSSFGFGGNVSFWSTAFGVVGYLAALVKWPHSDKVFLDVCCIHQGDQHMKAEGILSMGGILRRSNRLLVLWDVTYAERLWCVFELAAFMRASSGSRNVVVRPTLLGTCALSIFCAVLIMVMILAVMISHNREGPEYLAVIGPLLLLILFPAAATFRAYFQSVETLSEQLKEFRVNNTKCHCCSVNHVDKSGNAIPFCDREVVLRCIRNWFGSEEAFEEEAKTMLSAAIPTQLGQTLFPYPLLLVATMPLLWIMLDLAIENILFMKLDMWWLFWLISGVGWWMGSFPFFLASFFYAARCMRQPRGYRVLDWLANLLVISSILPVFIFTFGVVVILVFFTPLAEWQVALVSSAIHILTAALVWNAQAFCRRNRKGTTKSEPSAAEEVGAANCS
mmetsp:Transcript_72103/g.168942  ORF Transcript_72103/g.168942 Transcript_72103/m.168942 type:complete len:530 (+) Transcript_72103:51-1640(+)